MNFNPEFQRLDKLQRSSLFFVFNKNRLLIKNTGETITLPTWKELEPYCLNLIRKQHIGTLDATDCYAAELETDQLPTDDYQLKDLRALFTQLDEDLIWIAGRANQLVDWQRTHQYCGACGQPTEDGAQERAKICPKCGLVNYPRLSPAIIVAITRGDKILLARNKRFKIPIFSVLAGFVEPSETLEQCVRREVKEEVGIDVEKIRYFGSQPWPFPNSLMVGFTAEYAAGEIKIDPSELKEAGWFTADELPRIPPTISIAGRLIEWFKQKHIRQAQGLPDDDGTP